jgi:aminoglycoside phosphotransferase (APT) family kinase protein
MTDTRDGTAVVAAADPAIVGPWLADETGDDRWTAPTITLLSGGKSNLTYVVRADDRELILRRPPTGHVLPTAHDMRREARIMGGLGPTGFPVPHVFAVEPTGELLGQPFYVMERVHGHIVRDEFPAGYATTDAERRQVAGTLISTLARLHAVDYEAAGLGDFGRPAGYMERQVRLWSKQSAASTTTPQPEVESLAAALTAALPAHSDNAIVHGDYRLDNCVLDSDDPAKIVAVLDWEMSTLGDPLADLGVLLVYWQERGDAGELTQAISRIIPQITMLSGFPTRSEVAETYARESGRDLTGLPYYVAFGYFKFAVVVQGIVARSAAGAMGGQDFSAMAQSVALLIERGQQVLASGEIG